MSKKLENIDIEVNELKGKSLPTWEVVIPNKKSIGLIEKGEGRYRATTLRLAMFYLLIVLKVVLMICFHTSHYMKSNI